MDQAQIIDIAIQQMEKEKKSKAERLEGISKRMDHLERAFREQERPLLVLDYQRQQDDDRRQHESTHAATQQAGRDAHDRAIALKARLQRLLPQYDEYRKRTGADAERQNAESKDRASKQIEQAKATRRRQVLAQREEERIAREKKEAEDREIEARLVAERQGAVPFLRVVSR